MTTSQAPISPPALDALAVGFAAQLVVLAGLATVHPLGLLGWLCGTAYAVATWIILGRAVRHARLRALGAANAVTLTRTTLVGGVLALVADAVRGPVPTAALIAVAAVALALDGVDGQVARRTGTVSAFGARFDMEVDAILILVLSAYVALSYGWWVLAIGALRYVFVAAARVLPWMRAALPARYSRKVVAALQGIVLVVAASDLAPRPVAVAAVGLALGSLCWSFGRDVRWLFAVRTARTAPLAGAPARRLEVAATATNG